MVDEPQRITSLKKPPEGWVWSPEARALRQQARITATAFHRSASPTGPSPDAEPTATLPTFTPGLDKLPDACSHCSNRLLAAEEPLGQHRRGTLTCTACGRQLAWLRPSLSRAARPSTPAPALAPEGAPEWRRPWCGETCRRERVIVVGAETARVGAEWREYHDVDTHDRHLAGLGVALTIALATRTTQPLPVVETGSLLVELHKRRVRVYGRERHLTPIEWEILAHLARNLDYPCSADQIVADVWPGDISRQNHAADLERDPRHILRVNLSRLRSKLGPAASLITTASGGGWRLEAEPPIGGDA